MKISRPDPIQKLPDNKKLVFKGVIFDIFQWEQELFDGTKQTFEILKRQDTVISIPVTKDKKIIIIKEAQPGKPTRFTFPGGRMEHGEDVVKAAKRELSEETGYSSDNLKLLKTVTPLSKIDWVVYYFIAKDCEKIHSQQLDSGENIIVKLIDFETMIEMLINEEIAHEPDLTKIALRARLFPEEMRNLKNLILD